MAGRKIAEAEPADRVLVIKRVFDAPRELVFKAWTEPQHIMKWLGPRGFTATSAEMDLRPGGKWSWNMISPEGHQYPSEGIYREIVRPERLVFTFGWRQEPRHETTITITFTDRGGKTEMTFRQSVFETVESRDSHEGGWTEAFEKLAQYLRT